MAIVIRFSIFQIQHQCYSSHAPVANKIRSTYNFKDIQQKDLYWKLDNSVSVTIDIIYFADCEIRKITSVCIPILNNVAKFPWRKHKEYFFCVYVYKYVYIVNIYMGVGWKFLNKFVQN